MAFTVMDAVLFALIAFVQIPDKRFFMVIVVAPTFAKVEVIKLPVPAVVTFIVAVEPVAELAPLKSYVPV